MPEYSYQARSEDGQSVTGELSADSVSAALALIEARGLTVESISLSIGQPINRPSTEFPPDNPIQFDKGTLDRQFDAVIGRREILVPALTALSSEMPVGQARRDIRRLVDLLAGAQTSADLRRNELAMRWLPLLASGFTTESSARRLSDLIARASRESENRSQRRRLLAYPLVVLLIALLVFAFLCVVVVPTFSTMFAEFGTQVPTATRVVIEISYQMLHNPIPLALVVILIAAAMYGLARLWVHYALTTRTLGVLVAGNSANVSAMSSLTNQLAELLSIDVSLPDALWIAGQGCQHYHFKNVAEQLARHAHGAEQPLSESFLARSLPANVIHALQAGPEDSPSVPLLRELSQMYGDRVGGRVDWTTGIAAQFAIVVVGIAVAFVVITLFTPMIFMISSLS